MSAVLVCYFLGPLFTDWVPGCYVRCGCISSPVFSFPMDGGWGWGGFCPLVLCSLLLFSLLDRLRLVWLVFFVKRFPSSSCSSERASFPV